MNISIINESISSLTGESQAAEHLRAMLITSIPEEIKGQMRKSLNDYQRLMA